MKKFFDFSSAIFLFFLTGFLAAISAFLFQVFFSQQLSPGSSIELLLFVFLEEGLKLFFWSHSINLVFSNSPEKFRRQCLFSFFFASGFWFLEIFFLKLKLAAWPPFFPSGILFIVHWLTTGLIAAANGRLTEKKYFFFMLLFLLSLLLHFAYNRLLLN